MYAGKHARHGSEMHTRICIDHHQATAPRLSPSDTLPKAASSKIFSVATQPRSSDTWTDMPWPKTSLLLAPQGLTSHTARPHCYQLTKLRTPVPEFDISSMAGPQAEL